MTLSAFELQWVGVPEPMIAIVRALIMTGGARELASIARVCSHQARVSYERLSEADEARLQWIVRRQHQSEMFYRANRRVRGVE